MRLFRPVFAGFLLLTATFSVPMLSAPANAQMPGLGQCLVIAGAVVEDIAPCERQVETFVNDEGREVRRYIHVWPSGSQTILEMDAEVTTINGVPTRPVGGILGVSCVQNPETERFFCFFYLPGEEQ